MNNLHSRGTSYAARSWFAASALVGDFGDDHEMGEDSGNSLARAGDRLIGFAAGAGVLALAWVMWTLL